MSAAEESPRITSESRTADRRADGFGRKPCGAQKRPEKSDNLFKLPKGLAALKNRRQPFRAAPGFCGCCRDPLPVWRAVPAMHGSKLNINFRQMSRIEKDRERMPP